MKLRHHLHLQLEKLYRQSNGNGITHTETTLKANDTLSITSGHDTTIKGAIVSGNTVIADIGTNPSTGGNLRLESEQDSANYKSKQNSISGGISYTFGAGGFGGSLSVGKQKVNSTYDSVIEQTAIQAGNGGFDINVAGNTHLKGAVIDSTLTAQQQGNNQLTTQTLTTENIKNKGEYTASSSSVGISANGSPETGTNKPAGGTAGSTLKTGLSGSGGTDSGEAEGTTYAAISPATVTITDEEKQKTLTGKTAAETVATLNRDTQHANGSIENPYDQQRVAEQLEFLQLASEIVLQPVAAQAAKWIGDAFPPDPNDPTKINVGKILAHATLGAAMSQLLGTGWETGAAAGALGDILPNILSKAFEKDPITGKPKNEAAFKAANAIISAALSSATGADLAQTINAGMITQNAVANNFLGHVEQAELAKLRAQAKSGKELKADEKKQLIYLEATNQLSDGLLNKYRSGETLTETEQKNLNIYLGLYATQNGEAATILLLKNGGKPDYDYPYAGSSEEQIAYMKNLNDWKVYVTGRDMSANEQLYRDARAETGLYLNTVRNEAFLPTSIDNAQKVSVLDALINSPVLATGTYLGGTALGTDQSTLNQATILASQLSDIGASFILPKTGLSPVLGETTVNPKSLPLGTSKVFWVFENAGMSEQAKNYNDAATGARSDGLTNKGMAPALESVAKDGKTNIVKFDGVDGNTLIDRKLSVVTTEKSKDQALRQSEALMQNGLVGRWEVPTTAQANRAAKMFEELGIKNIQIKVVKP